MTESEAALSHVGAGDVQPLTLPRVVLSSVVRSSHQGESHGGVYMVDFASRAIEQLLDWDDPSISWEGRGADRGLRGISFHADRVLLAASDEIFIYDRQFRMQGSFRNPYLKHCHEITVDGDRLLVTSTGFDSVLEYDLTRATFTDAFNVASVVSIGIADSLIRKLSSLKGFVVRPLSVMRKYADVGQDPLAAGREQRADYVLASNYQLEGGKIRITAQLLNVASGQIEETYKSEKDAANVFATQDAISGEIGNVLSARFATTSRGRTAKRGTTNEEAYRLYLQGIYTLGKRSPADAKKAVEVLEQSTRLDPNYAGAWAGLAQAHRTIGNFGGSNIKDEYEKSLEAINKALALDENLADAHCALCVHKMSYEWDFDGAERECKRAIELDLNSSQAHSAYSRYLNCRGRFDEAIAEIKTAIDLEPASLVNQRDYGVSLYYARRYPEAVMQLKRVIAMDEKFGTTYNWLVVSLEMLGNYPEAFEWWMKMQALYKGEPEEAIQAFQAAYQSSGWQGLMLERTRRCDEASLKPNYPGPYFQGAIEHAKAGHKDKAFERLEKSYQRRESWMSLLKVEPGLDSLRDDQRFDELVKRVGLK